jgi:hypothetical protein
MIDPATFNTLRQFRAGVYDRFGARRDALFELLDAATVAGLVPSLAYLSLPPVHRRRWGSLYDALVAGDIDAPALRELLRPLSAGEQSTVKAHPTMSDRANRHRHWLQRRSRQHPVGNRNRVVRRPWKAAARPSVREALASS